GFANEDLSRGCTVVLAHRFWQGVLHREPGIVGQELRLDDQSCTVIGVMPAGFVVYPEPTAVWALITPSSEMAKNPDRRIAVFGRLRPSVSRESAEAELRALAERIEAGARYGAAMEAVVYPV